MFAIQTLFFVLLKSQSIITTIAGNGISGYTGDGGLATSAQLNYPTGIAFDTVGNIFIAEQNNHCIRKINTSGIISTIAGIGTSGYSGDGGAAISAKLNLPTSLAFDTLGNLYFTDQDNNRIRKIDGSGIITTIAGNGIQGYSGDGGIATAAAFYHPTGLIVDDTGNIFITDAINNRIRKINKTTGVISTISGNGVAGFSGDNGLGINAELNNPWGITLDKSHNLFIADAFNHRMRKINNSDTISTCAGNGAQGYNGDGILATSAEISFPFGVIFDISNNLYISDWGNNRIRQVNGSGIISTIAGNGTAGYTGDGAIATLSQLNGPCQIAFDKLGNLYIADGANNVIRKVTNVSIGVNEIKKENASINIYPNPNTGNFTVTFTGKVKNLTVEIYNVFGQQVLNRIFDIENTNKVKIDNLSPGVYLVKLLIDGIHDKTTRIIVTK